MANYVVDEEFLKDLGFDDFDSIEMKKTNSWWDLKFVLDKVKEHLKNNGVETYDENEIIKIANNVLESMDNIDYSEANEQIDELISEESHILIEDSIDEHEYESLKDKVFKSLIKNKKIKYICCGSVVEVTSEDDKYSYLDIDGKKEHLTYQHIEYLIMRDMTVEDFKFKVEEEK